MPLSPHPFSAVWQKWIDSLEDKTKWNRMFGQPFEYFRREYPGGYSAEVYEMDFPRTDSRRSRSFEAIIRLNEHRVDESATTFSNTREACRWCDRRVRDRRTSGADD